MDQTSTYRETREELIRAVTDLGYPAALGEQIAKNLGSEKMMHRFTAYLLYMKPRSAEEIVDEMLGLMEDRKRWVEKKMAEEANAAYNAYLNAHRAGWDEEE